VESDDNLALFFSLKAYKRFFFAQNLDLPIVANTHAMFLKQKGLKAQIDSTVSGAEGYTQWANPCRPRPLP